MQRLALGGADRYAGRSAGLRRALGRQIFEGDAATAPQSFSRSGNATQELRMVFQSIVEPVVLALEADQHSSRLAMSRDEDFLGLRQTQKSGQIVLYLSEGRLAYWASRAGQASARLRLS